MCLVCSLRNVQVIGTVTAVVHISLMLSTYTVSHSDLMLYQLSIIYTAVQSATTRHLLSQERKATLVHTPGLPCKVLHQGMYMHVPYTHTTVE